eukprot:1357680-Pleurochrysis_carterae.AAC.3
MSSVSQKRPAIILSITYHQYRADEPAETGGWIRSSNTVAPLALKLRALQNFGWVGRLTAARRLSVSLCLKGLQCKKIVPRALRQMFPAHLHSCLEEPGGRRHGTEAVCAFRFILENLKRSDWTAVFFAHGDIAYNPSHARSFRALGEYIARPAATWAWANSPSSPPGSENFLFCGCDVVHETLWPEYRWRWAMHASVRRFLNHSLAVGRDFQWPRAFMFGVDRRSVVRHSSGYYEQ